jgi:hypothetical protein
MVILKAVAALGLAACTPQDGSSEVSRVGSAPSRVRLAGSGTGAGVTGAMEVE